MTEIAPVRWGLCCMVLDAPLRFRAATHAYAWRLPDAERAAYLDDIALHNAASLIDVLQYCRSLGIHAFRIPSGLFPLATHPLSGYGFDALPSGGAIRTRLAAARALASEAQIRLSFHPDQFVVLNSTRPEVVASAIAELEWQAEMAEAVGADVICIHGGSLMGGVDDAIRRLEEGIARLSTRARSRLALENDDRSFTAVDLMAPCLAAGVPLILDAHHHRVLDGGVPIENATAWAVASWGDREPYFHVSSPRNGWANGDPRPHADFVEPTDVPRCWLELGRRITVDVEAKAKERAILALRSGLAPTG